MISIRLRTAVIVVCVFAVIVLGWIILDGSDCQPDCAGPPWNCGE